MGLRLHGFFVDLYVRASNAVAIQMYGKLGYIVYRRVLGYYSADATTAEEDAYGRAYARMRAVCVRADTCTHVNCRS